MRKSKKTLSIFAVVIFTLSFFVNSKTLHAQNSYNGEFENHFFGWMPSARMEAMGKGFVGVGNDPHSYYVNPGAMGTLDGLNVTAGFANPYYTLRDAGYNYFSASYNLKNIGVVGVSRDYSDWGKVFVTNEAGQTIGEFIPNNTNYRFTFSREIVDDFYTGINLNLFGFDYDFNSFNFNEKASTFTADLGVLKSFEIIKASNGSIAMGTDIGASLFNITNSKLELNYGKEVLPVILRIGGSYNLDIPIPNTLLNTNFLSILYAIEYQNVLNGEDYNGIKSGLEVTLFELLSLRGGFYSLGLRDQSACSDCKGKIQEVTYGAGINLPLQNLGITKIPAEFRFDLAVMPQPPHITNPEDFNFGDYRVFNFTANVEF